MRRIYLLLKKILPKVIDLVSSRKGQVTHFSLTPFPLGPEGEEPFSSRDVPPVPPPEDEEGGGGRSLPPNGCGRRRAAPRVRLSLNLLSETHLGVVRAANHY